MTIFEKLKLFFRDRKTAYEFTFDESNHAKAVLKDLAKFCRANETAFHPDPRIHAVLEGRREVWLRIQNYLNLNPEELVELYRKDN